MCKKTEATTANTTKTRKSTVSSLAHAEKSPSTIHVETCKIKSISPSIMARFICALTMFGIFGIWGKLSFISESELSEIGIQSYQAPFILTFAYLTSLPILKFAVDHIISQWYNSADLKLLLKESMILYNAGQVLLNGWMVWKFVDALWNKGHPFVGDIDTCHTGTTYGVWIHYCDKYLEFFDTFFMVLRGRMDQVSFLHVYHHFSIAWAWWIGIIHFPCGDSYFGALLNSWIHVMMYSYYTLSLLKISCPWKRYLTQAQLVQFVSVVVFSFASATNIWKHDGVTHKHYLSLIVQVLEMVSLFYLFAMFYQKSYSKAKMN